MKIISGLILKAMLMDIINIVLMAQILITKLF